MIAMTVKRLLALIRLAPPNAAPTPMLTCASAPGTSALPCSLGRRLAHPNLCIAGHPSQPFSLRRRRPLTWVAAHPLYLCRGPPLSRLRFNAHP